MSAGTWNVSAGRGMVPKAEEVEGRWRVTWWPGNWTECETKKEAEELAYGEAGRLVWEVGE